MKEKEPDIYIDNCHFNDIYSLFLMDRELRFLLLRKLIKIEQRIKASVCRIFTDHYPEAESYLEICSYSDYNPEKRDELIKTLREKKEYEKSYLVHYKKKHSEVPLWVLSNNLTFGNIKYFYTSLNRPIRKEIAKDLSEKIVMPHANKKLYDNELETILIVASHFRNICAHDERLYNEKAKVFVKNHVENTKYYNFMEMYHMVKQLLLPDERDFLVKRIKSIMNNKYEFSDESIRKKILKEMGAKI